MSDLTVTVESTDISPFTDSHGPSHHFTVRARFSPNQPVDRLDSHGIVVRGKGLADRLAAAMQAGVIFTDFAIRTDVNGNTFLTYRTAVLARYVNADLKRLGF